jgi:protoporphyrinogen/coproporphyrinogen III oxidase
MSHTAPWIIVGGGASGLASAFFLKQRGIDSVIVERDGTLGGRMGTVRLGDRDLDCGGKNIGRQYRLFRQFAASLGSHPMEHFGLNSSQAVNGRIRTFDGGARWRTMARLASGLSANDMVRFGRLVWRVKRDEATGYLGTEWSRRLSDSYDDLPVNRYFSPEFCERIIRPMTVRMNGAEPAEIYMGTLLSNVRMILDSYEQFTHGLAPLLNACVGAYDVRLNTTVQELLVEGDRVTGVRVADAHGETRDLRGAGVILATPAPTAARLTASLLPGLADQLRSVAYYPVTLVLAEYDRPIFSSSVRAIVFDHWHALSNAGAYGINDLNVVRYTFSGRTARRLIDTMDADALLHCAETTLSRYVAVERGWRRRVVVRRFNPGLCAYTPHHTTFLDRIIADARQIAGLYLTGDYVQGASIEACFRAASACVQQLATRHHSPLERCDSRIVA